MDAADAAHQGLPAAEPAREPPRALSAWAAAILGWIVPGLGQAYAGRPGRGLYFAGVVLATYVAGFALTDFRGVSWERERIWFVADALVAGPTALADVLTSGLEVVRRAPTYDVGLLYAAVAGLLNMVVVGDALGLVDAAQRTRRAWERERAFEEEERARLELEAQARSAASAVAVESAAAETARTSSETVAGFAEPDASPPPPREAEEGGPGADAGPS